MKNKKKITKLKPTSTPLSDFIVAGKSIGKMNNYKKTKDFNKKTKGKIEKWIDDEIINLKIKSGKFLIPYEKSSGEIVLIEVSQKELKKTNLNNLMKSKKYGTRIDSK